MKMTPILTITITLAIALVPILTGCDRGKTPEAKPPSAEAMTPVRKVSVRIPWIRTAATTGLEVAAELGYFKAEGLDVDIRPGSVEASPLRKVIVGEDQFGIIEPAQVIVNIAEQKSPLKILALKAQKSPFCLMSRTEKNIRTLKDLAGKRVGYNPLNDISYLSMLNAGGVKRNSIKEIRAQFNLEPFLQGQVDVWPSYISNEPVAARSKGLDVSLICADDVGVHLYEHALFARADFIEQNPAVVEGFIRAWLKGWQQAMREPEQAVQIVLKRTQGLDPALERKVLEIFIPLLTAGRAQTNGLGWVDAEMVDGIGRIVESLKLVTKAPAGSDVVDNRFLLKIDRSIPAKP